MNFNGDLKRIVVDQLNTENATFDPTKTVHELLVSVLTVEERRIKAIARRVNFTKEFSSAESLVTPDELAGIAEIIRKFIAGEDVNPHLNKRRLQPLKDDDLLTDWGIYHFHLGQNLMPGSQFVTRSGPLAFAHVTDTDVFFIDVLNHGKFDEPQLIETLLNCFPSVAEKHEVRGVTDTAIQPPNTAAQVAAMRSAHINTPIKLNGKIYFGPGGGFAASGVSSTAVMRANTTMHRVQYFTRLMRDNEVSVRKQLSEKFAGRNPETFEFALDFRNHEWCVVEQSTDTILRFELLAKAKYI